MVGSKRTPSSRYSSVQKRGQHGSSHSWSRKHLLRYVAEFAGRHDARELYADAKAQSVVAGLIGWRWTCKRPIESADAKARDDCRSHTYVTCSQGKGLVGKRRFDPDETIVVEGVHVTDCHME